MRYLLQSYVILSIMLGISPCFVKTAMAQTPPCAVSGDAGNSYETCSSGVCESFICNGTAFVTLSSRAFAGWESVKFGNDTSTCNAVRSGRIRYTGGTGWDYCNGSSWLSLVSVAVGWPQSVTGATTGNVFRITGSNYKFLSYSTNTNNTSVFVGREAGNSTTTRGTHTLVGYQAGRAVSGTDTENTLIGYKAGTSKTGGSGNVLIGSDATGGGSTVSSNTLVGWGAGSSISDANMGIGVGTGQNATSTVYGTYLGAFAGWTVTGNTQIIIGANSTSGLSAASAQGLNIYFAFYGNLDDNDGGVDVGDNDATITIDGSVKIGTSSVTCNSTIAGTLRYSSPNMQVCNGTAWTNM